jgi:hypothetical protein
MFGDDDNDDANHSSDANTVGSGLNPGTSDVKSKFTSLALFSLLWKPAAHFPLFLATVLFSLFTNIFFLLPVEADNESVDSDYVYDPSSG